MSTHKSDESRVGLTNLPCIVEDRKMMSRTKFNSIQFISQLVPGNHTGGCCEVAPTHKNCPCCAILPCLGEPEYIVKEREASKYVIIRENSLEWNNPVKTSRKGCCCGIDPLAFRVQDNVHVLYFDDPIFDSITNNTGCCQFIAAYCCGGRGQRIRLASPACGGCCVRGQPPCCLVPYCFTDCCCFYVAELKLYVEDAEKGVYEIKEAVRSAKIRLGDRMAA